MNGIIILILWFFSVFLATTVISHYIKMQRKSDVAIAMYVLYLAISQIMAAKMGSFITIGNWEITAPTAVLIFPFTFQITDMVNEYFGQKQTHRMILIAFFSQILMTLFLWFSIEVTPAVWWGEESQTYWTLFLGSTLRITLASWVSFLITENLDAVLYAKIKKWTKSKHLWVRNVLSDIPTLALDSFIFVTIAFAGGGFNIWPVILGQMVTKWFFGVIDTPFMYLSRAIVDGKVNLLGNLFKSEVKFQGSLESNQ